MIDDTTGELDPGRVGTHSGLGDVMLSGTLYDPTHTQAEAFCRDLTRTRGFGTAKASEGLGTGQSAYAAQRDALKERRRFGLFGTAGYVVRGSPGDIDLREVSFGHVGADPFLTQGARAGASFAYRTSSIVHYHSVNEASDFAARGGRIGKPTAFKGAGDSSPPWGVGVPFSRHSAAGRT